MLEELVREQNDRTLEEYLALYQQKTGAKLSPSALRRALGRLRITRKKGAACQ